MGHPGAPPRMHLAATGVPGYTQGRARLRGQKPRVSPENGGARVTAGRRTLRRRWLGRGALRAGAATMLVIAVGLTAVACSGGDSSASSSSSDVSTAAATDGASTATDLQRAYVSAIHKASPSIVLIQSGGRLGSGVIFDTRGDIVTNAHVVGRARRFLVTLASGARSGATVVGSFPPNDVAVIRIAHAPAGRRPASASPSLPTPSTTWRTRSSTMTTSSTRTAPSWVSSSPLSRREACSLRQSSQAGGLPKPASRPATSSPPSTD